MAMCRVLKVSRGGYYAWRKRPVSGREMANQKLTQQIEEIHQHSRQTYGSPRIHAELADNGVKCGHNRVARLMRVADFLVVGVVEHLARFTGSHGVAIMLAALMLKLLLLPTEWNQLMQIQVLLLQNLKGCASSSLKHGYGCLIF